MAHAPKALGELRDAVRDHSFDTRAVPRQRDEWEAFHRHLLPSTSALRSQGNRRRQFALSAEQHAMVDGLCGRGSSRVLVSFWLGAELLLLCNSNAIQFVLRHLAHSKLQGKHRQTCRSYRLSRHYDQPDGTRDNASLLRESWSRWLSCSLGQCPEQPPCRIERVNPPKEDIRFYLSSKGLSRHWSPSANVSRSYASAFLVHVPAVSLRP